MIEAMMMKSWLNRNRVLYHFDEAVGTTAPSDVDGRWKLSRLGGNSAIQAGGKFNNCLNLDGANGFFSAYKPEMNLPANGPFTIECFAKTANGSAVLPIINRFSFSTGIGNHALFMRSGRIEFWWLEGGYYRTITSTVAYPLNQWMHIAIVRNGGTMTMYLNGVSVGSGAAGTIGASTHDLYIGRSDPSQVFYFIGQIDEIRWTMDKAVYTANFTPPTAPFN